MLLDSHRDGKKEKNEDTFYTVMLILLGLKQQKESFSNFF